MKGIYLVFGDLDAFPGVKKKVLSQIEALNRLGHKCVLHIVNVKESRTKKITNRLPFSRVYESFFDKLDLLNLDYLYIRKPFFSLDFMVNLKKIKEINPRIKILLEIPTYPYDQEIGRLVDLPILVKERHNRKKLRKYVDKIVTLTDDKHIFGIETVYFQNGIDVRSIKVRDLPKSDEIIILLGVASIAKWHGYDRLIRGMADYYKNNPKKQVHFYLVGDGEELTNLKKLANELGVSQYIFFEGGKYGEELDYYYNECNIGVGSLANHRKGLLKDSALKNREYSAKGLPFVIASEDNDFPDNFKYTHQIPMNESNVDINAIIDFYNKIKENDIISEMRRYAEENLTWDKKMKDVLKELR